MVARYTWVMKTITLCSSANFYKHVVEVQEQLQQMGYEALIPANAQQMKDSGDYDVSHYKTWFDDAKDYDKKAAFIRDHFAEIDKADAVLVVNDEKHGIVNYVGGNVLMEMAIAFHGNKAIYLLNGVPEESPFIEEIRGMSSQALDGDLTKLATLFPAD